MSETFNTILNKANEISAKLSSLLKKRNEENEMLNDPSFDDWFDYMLDAESNDMVDQSDAMDMVDEEYDESMSVIDEKSNDFMSMFD